MTLTTGPTAAALRCAASLATGVLLVSSCATSHGPGVGPTAQPTPRTEWGAGNYAINLYDAFGYPNPGLTQDFGFSVLIRYEGTTILFDGGSNADILAANAETLGVDLRDVDIAVASHSHFDHINGFDYLLEVNPDVTIYFPADMYWGKNVAFDATGPDPTAADALPPEQRYFGGATEQYTFNQSGRFWGADVKFISENTEIAPGVTLVTTTSPFMGYFTRYPSLGGVEGLEEHGDDIKTMQLPELSLNLETQEGDVLVVGCSHSLVETIVRETHRFVDRPIALVLGGYHLLPYNEEQVRAAAIRMRDELGVRSVAPTHCTGHVAFKVFREVFGDRYFVAGLGSTIPFPAPEIGMAPQRATMAGLAQ